MVVLDDDLLVLVSPHILAVDLCPCKLALPQCADIEIVVENALHSHKRPCSLNFPLSCLALGLLAHLLGHTRCGHTLLGQVVGNLLVAPAIIVVVIVNPAHNVRLGRYDLKLLLIVDDVAVRCGAQPFAVRLPPFDDVSHLARGIRDRHFVDEELKLDFQPVIVVRKVNAVADGDDANTCITQVFEFH